MYDPQYSIYFDNLLYNMLEGVAIHQLIFDENDIPIDYLILKVNNGYENILGYKKEDVEGKLASEVYGSVLLLEEYSNSVLNKISKKFQYYYSEIDRYFEIGVSPWNDIGFLSIFTDITERIQTNKKLEDTNKLLSLFIQHSPIHTFIKDVNLNSSIVLNASENYINMIGIKGSDMIGKSMEELFPIEFAKKMTNDDKNVVNNNEILKIEEELNNRTYSTIKYPIIIGNKKLLAGYSIDITDIKKFENELKHINEFNHSLLQTIPYGMDIVDKNGIILFSNKIFSEKFGNIVGSKCWDIHRDDKSQCQNCPLYSEINIGDTKVIETQGIHNGKIYEISHTGIIFNNEKSILEIFSDITNRKESENRLERAEIISKTGNWELHVGKNKILVSNGAKKIYGIENNVIDLDLDFVKKYALEEYRQLLDDELKNLIEKNTKYDVEFKISVNNEIKYIRSVASYNNKNNIVFGIIQDISSQKKNEEALEKSNTVKSVFLSNVSHELRTPMNAIIGFSDIILSNNKNKLNNENDRFLKSINSNAKHLDELLNNILDYSKIESDSIDILYENFSILDLFEELYDMFEDLNYRKNMDFVKLLFVKNIDEKIESDYLRLKQVLYNIISNSIKFTDNGFIKTSFSFVDDYVTFKIEDTGIGIPEDQLQYVFDRFWQFDTGSRKKYKGTGLGLSISKSIIELLNGEIWIESKINKGTTIYVKIPIKEKIIPKKINIEDFTGKTILIVDDIPIIFSLLGIYLNSLNVNLIYANGGKNAIEIYKKQKDKIDLLVVDLNLFDINGFELIKILKNMGNCKIISKSGLKDQICELVDYHLKKPINKDKLLSILNEIWQK